MIDSRIETYKHIQQVQQFIGRIVEGMLRRSRVHDQSKLVSPEVEAFDEFTPLLSSTTYGSEEYRATLSKMRPAIDHHQQNNSHHPEFYRWYCPCCKGQFSDQQIQFTTCPDDKPHRFCPSCCVDGSAIWEAECDEKPDRGIRGMTLSDLTEMLCDWKAASMRHADGDIRRSIEINQKRFGYSDELKQILVNTLREIEDQP